MKKFIKFLAVLLIVILLIQYIPHIVQYFFPRNYVRFVEKYSKEFDVDKNLVYAVIKAERSFSRDAYSKKGAKGLMQLTDETASWCAGKTKTDKYDIFDPEDNIKLGTYYLSYLIENAAGMNKTPSPHITRDTAMLKNGSVIPITRPTAKLFPKYRLRKRKNM